MRSPTKKGVSTSDVESQYDAYLLKERGLSRSTRNLHHHVVHRLLSARFPSGNIDWSRIRSSDFVQFLTSEFARLRCITPKPRSGCLRRSVTNRFWHCECDRDSSTAEWVQFEWERQSNGQREEAD